MPRKSQFEIGVGFVIELRDINLHKGLLMSCYLIWRELHGNWRILFKATVDYSRLNAINKASKNWLPFISLYIGNIRRDNSGGIMINDVFYGSSSRIGTYIKHLGQQNMKLIIHHLRAATMNIRASKWLLPYFYLLTGNDLTIVNPFVSHCCARWAVRWNIPIWKILWR